MKGADINDTLRTEGVEQVRGRHDRAWKYNGQWADAPKQGPERDREVKLRTHRDGSTASPKWLIKKLLPERGIGLLSGQWGTGKTAVLIELAAAVAMKDGTFAGLPIKRKGVALLFCLEGESGTQARLEAVSREKYDGAKIPVYFTAEQTNLLADGGVDRVIEIAKATAARGARVQVAAGVHRVRHADNGSGLSRRGRRTGQCHRRKADAGVSQHRNRDRRPGHRR